MKTISLTELFMAFPNISIDEPNMHVVSNGKNDLLELFTEFIKNNPQNDTQIYKRFLLENERYIDIQKYLLYQLARYDKLPYDANKKKAIHDIIKEYVKNIPERSIFLLDETKDGLYVVNEYSNKGLVKRPIDKKLSNPKYEKIFEDSNLLFNLAGVLMSSDLNKIFPSSIARQITFSSTGNALILNPDIDIDNADNDMKFRADAVYEMAEEMEKFKDKINYENWLLIVGYRLNMCIKNIIEKEVLSERELGAVTHYYNISNKVSEFLGDSRKIKLKTKLEHKEDGSYEFVSYSAFIHSKELERLRTQVIPSKFGIDVDPLEGIKEGEISLSKMFRKIDEKEDLSNNSDDKMIEETDKLAKHRINFISPTEKKKIFYGQEDKPLAYRGTKGKAYEGHAIYIYPKKGFAILECFYNKTNTKKSGKKFPYGDATVIVPVEQLENFLKSEQKLEKVPLAKELKAPNGEKARPITYQGHIENTKKTNIIEQRRPVRIYHTKNWKKRMNGILDGTINPFQITIVSSSKKKKLAKTDKQNKRNQNIENPEAPDFH